MRRVSPGATYPGSVLPAVIVFGIGLGITVAPLTATALAALDEEHAGVASGVNNAVARIAGLLAAALLPFLAGLAGVESPSDPVFGVGFHRAMLICAACLTVGGVIAAITVRRRLTE
jgi:MFS family permease